MATEVRQDFQLSTIVLHVDSVEVLERCKDWYMRLGLQHAPPDSPGESVWFDTAGTTLGIHIAESTERAAVTIYFNIAEVDAAYTRLQEEGFIFEAPPETKRWGGRVAYLKDPIGNSVGLVTPDR